MKRIMIAVIVLMLLMTGCESTPNISVSDSKHETKIDSKSLKENELENGESDEFETSETKDITFQEVENPKEEVQDEEVIPVVRKQSQKETETAEESKETTHQKNEPKPKKSPTSPNNQKEVVEKPKQETEPEQPEIKEPQKEEVIESEPIEEVPKEEVVTFDIGYWVAYAKSYAAGRGLSLDSTATDCWDNPITANPNCIYLERDIKDRINHYVDVEGFESVWIWYENIGDNSYLIYIGYA